MNHRITFTSITLASALFALACGGGNKDKADPKVLRFYTKDDPGMWDGKEDEHTPKITYKEGEPRKFKVTVPLVGTERPIHRIEAIILYAANGTKETEISSVKFNQVVVVAAGDFELPERTEKNKNDIYFVVAKCNLHDMWRVPVSGP